MPTSEPEPTPAPTSRTRTPFWVAFVVTFALLALASCGGVAALVGFDDFSFADFQSTGPVWTPPAAPTAVDSANVDSTNAAPTPTPSSRFQPGGSAENATSSRVNIRRAPGYVNKPADDIVAQMQPGEDVEIVGWSRSVDSLIWWPIRYRSPDGASVEGWVAESTESGVQILAPLP
ncbi:MAG: hypothetical protein R2873_18805 [Caldilineaceae bacterium]